MDEDEIKERVKTFEGNKARDGRIDWYERNVPIWWKALNDLFADPVWRDSDLNSCCQKWFGCPEAEMRAFLKGEWRDYQPKPPTFQEAAKVVFKPILDRQEKEKLEDELDAKARKALRQARWRAKKKLEAGK